MFLYKRSDLFVLPLLFYNDNIKEFQRYIKQFRRLWLCRNHGIMEALPRQQDNEYGISRLVVSWSCSLRSIIRLPAPKIYLLYSLYHLYLCTIQYTIYKCRQYPPRPQRKTQANKNINPIYHPYFLTHPYPLYLFYKSPSTHPILLNSVSSITLTAYTHYGLVLQRYEYLRYHCPVMSGYVYFLFVKS